MKKRAKHEDPEVNPQEEVDVVGLINAIQESLESIEKKIDLLLSRPQERASEGKPFSRPFQRFDRDRQHSRGRLNDSFRERKLYRVICADCKKECEVPFNPTGDRPVYCKECFARRKDNRFSFKDTKFERRPKDRDFTPGRHFDKKQSVEDKGGGRKKKPFSRKRR